MKNIRDRAYRLVVSIHIRWIVLTWEFQEVMNEFIDDLKKIANVSK